MARKDPTGQKTNFAQVAVGVVAAVALASVFNTALSLAAQGLGASATVIQGLYPASYITLTAVGVVIAAAGWALIRAKSRHPRSLMNKLVPVVVAVSFLADIPLFTLEGAHVAGVIALMLMHVVVAGVAVPIFRKVLPLEQAGMLRQPTPRPQTSEDLGT